MPQKIGARERVEGREDPSWDKHCHLSHWEDIFTVCWKTGRGLIEACHYLSNRRDRKLHFANLGVPCDDAFPRVERAHAALYFRTAV